MPADGKQFNNKWSPTVMFGSPEKVSTFAPQVSADIFNEVDDVSADIFNEVEVIKANFNERIRKTEYDPDNFDEHITWAREKLEALEARSKRCDEYACKARENKSKNTLQVKDVAHRIKKTFIEAKLRFLRVTNAKRKRDFNQEDAELCNTLKKLEGEDDTNDPEYELGCSQKRQKSEEDEIRKTYDEEKELLGY
jgi:hypothetical protein